MLAQKLKQLETNFIELNGVCAGYGNHCDVLTEVSLKINEGERVAVVGPNGTGKSTLLRVLSGELSARRGTCRIAGRDPSNIPAKERAQTIATVQQDFPPDVPFTAKEFVSLGRFSRLSRFSLPSKDDENVIEEAMQNTDTLALSHKPVAALSGGERQRLALAMALAAQPRLLLLDEPTAHLDLRHQAEFMELMCRLTTSKRMTVFASVHDLSLASRYFPRIVVLSKGSIVADAESKVALNADLLSRVYECNVSVEEIKGNGLFISATPSGKARE